MFCNKCGKEITNDSIFCSWCGAKQATTCGSCGAELQNGALFCHKCGNKVGDVPVAPVVSAVQSPVAVTKGKASPDVRGFYKNRRYDVCSNDKAAVFCDNSEFYLYDKEGKLYKASKYISYVGMTDDNVYAIEQDYDGGSQYILSVLKYDYQLNLISQHEIDRYEPEGIATHAFTMNGEAFYKIKFITERGSDGNEVATDVVFTRTDLETLEKKEYRFDKITIEGGRFTDFGYGTIPVDEDKLYLEGRLVELGEASDYDFIGITVTFNFADGKFDVLWKEDAGNYGKPIFFDFAKKIMWTVPTKNEADVDGWDINSWKYTLVARRIARDSAILSNFNQWKNFEIGSNFTYFDGSIAYIAPTYHQFYGVIGSGAKSEDWNKSGHGRTETTVVWNDKIISDIYADYNYMVYPAEVCKPDDDRIVKPDVINV